MLHPRTFLLASIAVGQLLIATSLPAQLPGPWRPIVAVTAGGAIGEPLEVSMSTVANSPTYLAASVRPANGPWPLEIGPPFLMLLNGVVTTSQTPKARIAIPNVRSLIGLPVYFQGVSFYRSTPQISARMTWHVAPNIARRFQAVRPTHPGLFAMPMDRTDITLPDGSFLFTGGRRVTDILPNPPLTTVFHYDALQDTLTRLPGMTRPRAGHTAVTLPGGKVLIVGGDSTSTPATAELYDPALQRFASLGAVPRALDGALGVPFRDPATQKDWVLFAGGRFGVINISDRAMLYDVANQIFSAVPKMVAARDLAAAIAVPGGVLISGGLGPTPTSIHRSVEFFSIATRSFHSWGRMLKPRMGHAMLTVNATTALTIGGWGGGPTIHRDIEVFDALRQRATPYPVQLALGRAGFAPIRLPDGSLFISDGATGEVLTATNSTLLRPVYTFGFGLGPGFMPAPGGGVLAFGSQSIHYLR